MWKTTQRLYVVSWIRRHSEALLVLSHHHRLSWFSSLAPSIERRLESLKNRHDDLLDQLHRNSTGDSNSASQSNITLSSSSAVAATLGKELSKLSRVAALYTKRQALLSEVETIRELFDEAEQSNDTELISECQRELESLRLQQEQLDQQIVEAVIPQDDDDYTSDAVIEVRAGTGGDEASLFCAELLESYVKTAAALKWKAEILTQSATEVGGVREAALSVSGPPTYPENDHTWLGPYGVYKFESGTHRVQRVPVNDSRIHTSACSVAVLPFQQSDDSSADIPPSDLRIETMRASGAGGQHINTTDSAVRITHIPTGITASIQDERSQHKNKDKALKLIAARVRDHQREEQERQRGDARSSLMGGGDRSERIRTYNYPQDRVTDHRSKTTRHGIESLLAGAASDGLVVTFLPDLKALRREELLQQLVDDDAA